MEHVLYSNYCEWISEDDLKMAIMDNGVVESEDDITDEMMYDERNFLEESYWDDFRYELEKFFSDGNAWLLTGSIGRWDGRCRGGFIFNTFNEFARCLNACEYWKIVDNNGHLEIYGSHHDGNDFFEVKRVSNTGCEWYNNHCYDMSEEELHTKMWGNNFMTSLPHFAREVYGCKE